MYQQQQSLLNKSTNFVLLSCVMFITKILEITLEYWLPGITIRTSAARQPVDIKIAQIHTLKKRKRKKRDTHKDRESNAIDITTRNYYTTLSPKPF